MRGRNRAAVKARIRDIAKAQVFRDEKVNVTYSLPTNPTQNAVFWLGPAEGDNEPDDLGLRSFTDRYSIKVRLEVHGQRTAEAAEAECERLLSLFEDGIASTNHLRHPEVPFDRDPSTDKPYFDGVQTPYIGAVNGPNWAIPDGGSPFAWVEADLACRCNILRST